MSGSGSYSTRPSKCRRLTAPCREHVSHTEEVNRKGLAPTSERVADLRAESQETLALKRRALPARCVHCLPLRTSETRTLKTRCPLSVESGPLTTTPRIARAASIHSGDSVLGVSRDKTKAPRESRNPTTAINHPATESTDQNQQEAAEKRRNREPITPNAIPPMNATPERIQARSDRDQRTISSTAKARFRRRPGPAHPPSQKDRLFSILGTDCGSEAPAKSVAKFRVWPHWQCDTDQVCRRSSISVSASGEGGSSPTLPGGPRSIARRNVGTINNVPRLWSQ